MNGIHLYEKPVNEPILAYRPGSSERAELKAKLGELKDKHFEIPLIINGKEVRTGQLAPCVAPHDHAKELAVYHKAGEKELRMAIEASINAKPLWESLSWEDRAAIFKKAGDLLAGPWRSTLNAATMLGQSKNAFQAEIDSACELIDFFRFNTYYMTWLYQEQPYSPAGVWNRSEYRPLEGFVFAVTPFNFTSIAGNLPTAPALMGNTVVWKPASSAVYSAYFIMKLLQEAGLPDGVINFVPGPGAAVGPVVLKHPLFAGVHFTGSTGVFQDMWKTIGGNIAAYRSYPRIVGETGGKDFVVAHPSADPKALITALVRGAFEYQGQKCSAASRAYIPESLWKTIGNPLIEETEGLAMGSPEDFRNFINAVIDASAFKTITGFIDEAKTHPDAKIVAGGTYDSKKGYFIRPTIILANDPRYRTMVTEIFGPVLTVNIYPDSQFEETLTLCDQTSPYALTGAIFAQDRLALVTAERMLRHSAGNFYINDKPTGAVVGQQPFGGARASGTNDKAGSAWNLLRWTSVRSIKETFVPPRAYSYPFMEQE
ncbi:MAG TPA: L-glutamate gamma-semialdehyde dehydrogenase [Thermotogota bacterium]|jgi:1-pyrroline-5-carboxylate dehydrogenase|nr:L-glutamate gamma-semialdehyde dehydrogenase [Thermotogota bacterium]NLH18637.1 L-glutamate gamma-semialdehyde dehydrogenase [Thermotogaceae bacterium]OQC32707.1 MAG: 1-pyrroline-5-carboxylate dehydrogenase [Thermotogota bacterium ADurb.Bin062]HNW46880.1 L-glutamate gamma-semialdehyde dehydrogenase [Thermotogota bacterium]HNY81667.1 L-glutamate gamma-semialdehyde dehydrogenase [Thermotogota bacterium]